MITIETEQMSIEGSIMNSTITPSPGLAGANREKAVTVHNGWVALPLVILFILGSIALFIYSLAQGIRELGHPNFPLFIPAVLCMFAGPMLFAGFFTLQPNEARVLILFGQYKGTVREPGFHWGN